MPWKVIDGVKAHTRAPKEQPLKGLFLLPNGEWIFALVTLAQSNWVKGWNPYDINIKIWYGFYTVFMYQSGTFGNFFDIAEMLGFA